MKELVFLNKLITERKIEKVEISNEISLSYLEKSNNSLKSSKLLLENGLYEDSISSSYYSMYNSLLSLLFKVGIKSENHTGSIILLKSLFDKEELYRLIWKAKKERIDKQYYITSEKVEITKEIAEKMNYDSIEFTIQIKLLMQNLNTDKLNKMNDRYNEIIDHA